MATLTLIPASLHPSWSWIPGSVGPRSGPARTPFQWCPKTVRYQPGTLSDMNRNGVRQKSERCPTEIGISVRQTPEYAMHRTIHKNLGGTVNALDAWLVLRGLRTFALRMDAHNRIGQAVAEWLLRRPEVARVHYPGLASYPQAELFRRQMKHGGTLLSFELAGGQGAACRFLDRLGVILHAVSLGGMERLAARTGMARH